MSKSNLLYEFYSFFRPRLDSLANIWLSGPNWKFICLRTGSVRFGSYRRATGSIEHASPDSVWVLKSHENLQHGRARTPFRAPPPRPTPAPDRLTSCSLVLFSVLFFSRSLFFFFFLLLVNKQFEYCACCGFFLLLVFLVGVVLAF